jgi:hypothetical protein
MKNFKRNCIDLLIVYLCFIIAITSIVGFFQIPQIFKNTQSQIEEIEVLNQDVEIETLILPTKEYEQLELPKDICGSKKTYMDYRTITNKSSKQWYLQQLAHTDKDGFRKLNNYYLIAVGSFYSNYTVGKELLVVLDTGEILNALVGDIKQDRHTDSKNQYVPVNGNIVEFIVDKDILSSISLRTGDVSNSGLTGKIFSIAEVK